jgi:hypothetical protein
VLRSAPIKTPCKSLSGQRYLVLGAITEVNNARRLTQSLTQIEGIISALMSIVSCYRRVSAHNTTHEWPVLDVAQGSAIAYSLELAVPIGSWRPQLESDIRFALRLDRPDNAAKRYGHGFGFTCVMAALNGDGKRRVHELGGVHRPGTLSGAS